MAPKAVASSSSAPGRSSIDAVWEEKSKTFKPRAPRKLSRKSTDAEVQKAIYDSLRGMRPEEIDGHRDENGQTAREVIMERKRLHRVDPKAYPLGAKFYAEVRKRFQPKDRPEEQLASGSADKGAISPTLFSAMVAYKKTGNRAPFAACLAMLDTASLADLVGILRWALELRPAASAEQLKYSMDVVRFIARCQMRTKFPNEVQCMDELLDTLFAHVYSKCKCEQSKPSVFLEIHRDIIHLVLPQHAIATSLSHTGSFMQIESALVEASQPRIGMALFGSSLHAVLHEKAMEQIKAGVKALLATQSISAADLASAQKEVMTMLNNNAYTKMLPDRRTAKLTYRGREFNMVVKCLIEEVEAFFTVALKGAAASVGDTPPLFCENELVDLGIQGIKGQISDDLLAPWRAVREQANSALGHTTDSEHIIDFLTKREASLVVVDRTFFCDIEFVRGMVGEAGERVLQQTTIAVMPTIDKAVSLQMAYADLQALQQSDLHSFCPSAAQGSVKTALGYIQALLYGRRPAFASNPSHFLQSVGIAMQYFFRARDAELTLTGIAAANYYLVQAKARKEAGTLTLADLEEPTKFSWLLNSGETEALAALTTIAMEKTKTDMGAAVQKAEARKRTLEQTQTLDETQAKASKCSSELAAAMAMFSGEA